MIAKGEYPAELNIPLPFSLIINNVYKNRLEIIPAYLWLHNLYALERNSWKVKSRDRRKKKVQHIEIDYLAPDTAEEMIAALSLLESMLADAGFSTAKTQADTVKHIHCNHFERGKRDEIIIKPLDAIDAYRQMLHYYAIKKIAAFFDSHPELDFNGLCNLLGCSKHERVKDWVNIGGQIVPAFRVDELRKDIGEDKYKNWDEIHSVYSTWEEMYPLDKSCHAWATLAFLCGSDKTPEASVFKEELTAVLEIRRLMDQQIYESRGKD
jgi:hypothetical protein